MPSRFKPGTGETQRDYCDICRTTQIVSRRPEMDYTDNIGTLEIMACDDCAEEDRQMREGDIEPRDAADLGER